MGFSPNFTLSHRLRMKAGQDVGKDGHSQSYTRPTEDEDDESSRRRDEKSNIYAGYNQT